jgi:hypothetical protein
MNERSQTQKVMCVWFHLHEMPRIVKSIETESRLMVAREVLGEKWGSDC